MVTRADKGNCVVVLDRGQYRDNVLDFLNTDSFKLLSTSPSDKFLVKFKSIVNKTQPTFSSFGVSKYKFLPINPSVPKLYGLPKIHKPNIPIRPVVSFCGSPCYRLASWFNEFFLQITNFESVFSIKKSTELYKDLKHIALPDTAIMVWNVFFLLGTCC